VDLHRTARALTLAASAMVLGLLAVADPATSPLFPPCIWRTVTGLLCPGCGSARAIHALLRGEVLAAWLANPLAVSTVPLLVADVVERFRGRHGLRTLRVRCWYVRGGALAIGLFTVLRNLG
jgi:hypothetical protein